MEPRNSLPVGVVVERRTGVTRWAAHVWLPVSVFFGRAPHESWYEMATGDGWTQFCAGTAELELHRGDAEAYMRNLSAPRPSIYVILAPAKGEIPWRLHLVTASPSEAEAYTVGGDHLVEAVAMPDEIGAVVAEFAKAHFKPEPFKKRKRDTPPALEEQKFGKEPIFARRGGIAPGGAEDE